MNNCVTNVLLGYSWFDIMLFSSLETGQAALCLVYLVVHFLRWKIALCDVQRVALFLTTMVINLQLGARLAAIQINAEPY